MSFQYIRNAVSEAKIELKESINDITENVSDQVDGLVQDLKDALMTKEMQDAVNTIEFVLEKLKKADRSTKEYESFMFILFALVKKVQKLEVDSDWENDQTEPAALTEQQLTDVGRFGEIAVKMYPVSWSFSTNSAARSLGVSSEDLLVEHFTDDGDGGHCPKFLLFLDHQTSSLVLAIRGTFSLKDAILDAVAEDVPFLTGWAHQGILSGAQLILSKVSERLIEVLAQPEFSNYSLVVTGHSLGAGTAELITMELMRSNLLGGREVRCVALAPPPVFRSDLALPSNISSAIQIYVNNYDLVPRLSMASVARLLATVREVDSLGLSLPEQLAILTDRDTAAVRRNLETLRQIIRTQRQSFPDLEHPGTIYHIRRSKTDQKKQLVYPSKSKAFTRAILLLENMIVDHLHSSYEATILNLTGKSYY